MTSIIDCSELWQAGGEADQEWAGEKSPTGGTWWTPSQCVPVMHQQDLADQHPSAWSDNVALYGDGWRSQKSDNKKSALRAAVKGRAVQWRTVRTHPGTSWFFAASAVGTPGVSSDKSPCNATFVFYFFIFFFSYRRTWYLMKTPRVQLFSHTYVY